MYTGVSLLGSSSTGSLSSVGSAALCSVVGSTGSYSPGFISWSGRESISDSASASASASLGGLVVCIHVLYILLSCVEQVTAVLIPE